MSDPYNAQNPGSIELEEEEELLSPSESGSVMVSESTNEHVTINSLEELERFLNEIGVNRFHAQLLVICGGTQLADAMELLLLPFLPKALEAYEAAGSSLKVEVNESWFPSLLSFAVFAGMLIGAPSWGYLADRNGRRVGLCGSSFFVGFFGLTSSCALTKVDLIISRFLVGFGLGGASCGLALFTECLPKAVRQQFLVFFFLFFSIGSVLCALLAWYCLAYLNSWRWLLRFSSVPALVIAGTYVCGLVESPLFLFRKGRKTEMREVLNKMKSKGGNLLAMERFSILPEVPSSCSSEENGPAFGVIVILCSLFGTMAIIYYALVEASVSYLGGNDANVLSTKDYYEILMVNTGELPGLFLALLIIHRYGSKQSIVSMFIICGIFCLCMTMFVSISSKHDTLLGAILLFGARASALGFNQSLWIYSSVYFPTSNRALGVGFVTAFARIGGLISPFVGQLLFKESQALSLFICFLLCMFSALLTKQRIPNV